jgi:Fe-S cluster assembly protein SufD
MNTATGSRELYLRLYRQAEHDLPGRHIPWLRRLRAEAVEQFMATGFPGHAEEAWKYTDTRVFENRRFTLPAKNGDTRVTSLRPYALGSPVAHRLVFVDGVFVPELSVVCDLPPGAVIRNLASALEREGAATEAHLGQQLAEDMHGFAALNTAFLSDGAYIHLGRGVVVHEPVHLLFIASAAAPSVAQPRNLIVAGEDSRVTLIESYVTLNEGEYFTNAVTEIVAGKNAVVEHYKLERESEQAYHVAGIHVRQERDSRYTSHNVAAGGRLVRNDIRVALDGEGAECTLNGLTLARGRQHVDNHTRIDHFKPRGTSREWYKGVFDGNSRGVFSGLVRVHPDAQKTDAQLTNNNLLLSDGAEADSRPQLEIYADDVKCAHGSTVGQLDPDALFYLRSRAVDEALARNMLIYGFASDILTRMNLAPVRAQLEDQLSQRWLGRL